jgi:hypothetical protein
MMQRIFEAFTIVLNYILNVLTIAWTSLVHTLQLQAAALVLSPGLIYIMSALIVGYVYLLVQED